MAAQQQQGSLVDPQLFVALQAQLDDDSTARDRLRDAVQMLEKQTKTMLAHLTNVTSIASKDSRGAAIRSVLTDEFEPMRKALQQLQEAANPHPYYRFHGMWSRAIQDVIFATLLLNWHGGAEIFGDQFSRLMSLEDIAKWLQVPGSAHTADSRDVFHLSTEEYLHGVISLIDELARAARTAVTLGDYATPLAIARFVKDVHAGLGVLNLKNDSLRKRSDGVKYRVRETEDVVYDLTLRGLVPREG